MPGGHFFYGRLSWAILVALERRARRKVWRPTRPALPNKLTVRAGKVYMPGGHLFLRKPLEAILVAVLCELGPKPDQITDHKDGDRF